MNLLNVMNWKDKVNELYGKVPPQFQKYKDQISVLLENMQNECSVGLDNQVGLLDKIDKLEHQLDKLQQEYNELQKNYDKLNRKLNNELIK